VRKKRRKKVKKKKKRRMETMRMTIAQNHLSSHTRSQVLS